MYSLTRKLSVKLKFAVCFNTNNVIHICQMYCYIYVTGFVKKGLIHTFINIFEIFNSLYLRNAWSSLCAFLHQSIVIQDHSVDGLFNG